MILIFLDSYTFRNIISKAYKIVKPIYNYVLHM